MFVMNHSRKRISPIWFTVGFFLFAIALGLILRNFYNTDALLILVAGPILVAAVFYPRWVYHNHRIAPLPPCWSPAPISASYSSSIRSTVMIVLTLVVASEIIRRIIEVNSALKKHWLRVKNDTGHLSKTSESPTGWVAIPCHFFPWGSGADHRVYGTGFYRRKAHLGGTHPIRRIFPLIEDSFQLVRTQPNYAGQREYRIKRKDGKTVWIRENFQNVSGSDGKPEFIQGAIYDITDSKQIEVPLQRSQARSSAS